MLCLAHMRCWWVHFKGGKKIGGEAANKIKTAVLYSYCLQAIHSEHKMSPRARQAALDNLLKQTLAKRNDWTS